MELPYHPTTFLELHRRLLKAGRTDGLCLEYFKRLSGKLAKPHLLKDDSIFNMCVPTRYDRPWRTTYWAAEFNYDFRYNKTRQNIVLLCAAINNEL